MPVRFRRDALFLIAGPCQLEDDALNLHNTKLLARLAEKVPGGIIYKASFDKANRSNAGAKRGPGLEQGLAARYARSASSDLTSRPEELLGGGRNHRSERRKREIVSLASRENSVRS